MLPMILFVFFISVASYEMFICLLKVWNRFLLFVPCMIWRRNSTFLGVSLKHLVYWTLYVESGHFVYHHYEGI